MLKKEKRKVSSEDPKPSKVVPQEESEIITPAAPNTPALTSLVFRDDEDGSAESNATWESFNLNKKLLGAIKDLEWERPTLVQRALIPIALAGHNAIVHARTGSGKTAAFLVPVLDRIFQMKRASSSSSFDPQMLFRSVIFVPSVELVRQTVGVLKALTKYAGSTISIFEPQPYNPAYAASCWTSAQPGVPRYDVIVTTPAVLYSHLRQNEAAVAAFRVTPMIVMDEADSISSMVSMKGLHAHYPSACQTIMVSATLSTLVQELKQMFLRKPMVVTLEEEEEDELVNNNPSGTGGDQGASSGDSGRVDEFFVEVKTDEDRYTWLYALLRSINATGRARKHLIFVQDTDTAYRVKLFLESFSINSYVLHKDIPRESREHILTLFNESKSGQLIATEDEETSMNASGFGVRRGVDFVNVSHVIMFSCSIQPTPESLSAYTQRIGRTGRGGRKGTAILLLTVREAEEVLTALRVDCRRRTGRELLTYPGLDESVVSEFQYRCNDVLHSLTKKKVRQAHVKDIATEMLNCEKLQTHFQTHQSDQSALTHLVEASKSTKQRAQALSCVPFYMHSTEKFPQTMTTMAAGGGKDRVKPKRNRNASKDPVEHLRKKLVK